MGLPSACAPRWHSKELGRHLWTQWVLDRFDWARAMNYKHSDLRSATIGAQANWTSWKAVVVQALPVAILYVFHATVFSLAPNRVFVIIAILAGRWWLRGQKSWKLL